MLNEKQFRERAQRELRAIGAQVQGLITDREMYRRFEDEVVQPNPQLSNDGQPYLGLVRGSYTDAMIMRLRRLLAPEAQVSLRRVIAQVAEYPDLLHQKITAKEVTDDGAQLEHLAAHVKEHLEPHFSPHERTAAALGTAQRELDRALDALREMLQKYYWVIADSYLDLAPKYDGDPLDVFRSAWMK